MQVIKYFDAWWLMVSYTKRVMRTLYVVYFFYRFYNRNSCYISQTTDLFVICFTKIWYGEKVLGIVKWQLIFALIKMYIYDIVWFYLCAKFVNMHNWVTIINTFRCITEACLTKLPLYLDATPNACLWLKYLCGNHISLSPNFHRFRMDMVANITIPSHTPFHILDSVSDSL